MNTSASLRQSSGTSLCNRDSSRPLIKKFKESMKIISDCKVQESIARLDAVLSIRQLRDLVTHTDIPINLRIEMTAMIRRAIGEGIISDLTSNKV